MKINLNKEQLELISQMTLGCFAKDHVKMVGQIYRACEDALCTIDDIEEVISQADYKLSENQRRFVEDVIIADKEVDFSYSGRGMMGDCCPSVRLGRDETFSSDAETSQDNLGLGTVVYASH